MSFWWEGTGEILLDDVGCQGLESRIEECPSAEYSAINCNHAEDAGVACRLNEGDHKLQKTFGYRPFADDVIILSLAMLEYTNSTFVETSSVLFFVSVVKNLH